MGVIVDGVPPGMRLSEADIQPQMTRRRPGQSALTTPRDEKDRVIIQSGVENGKTLGTPVSVLVRNEDQRPHDYKSNTMDTYPRSERPATPFVNCDRSILPGGTADHPRIEQTVPRRLHLPDEIRHTGKQWRRPQVTSPCPHNHLQDQN